MNFNGAVDDVSVPIINQEEIFVSAWFYEDANDLTRSDAIFGGWRWAPDVQHWEGFCLNFFSKCPRQIEIYCRDARHVWKQNPKDNGI